MSYRARYEHRPVIAALERLRQEDLGFGGSLSYLMKPYFIKSKGFFEAVHPTACSSPQIRIFILRQTVCGRRGESEEVRDLSLLQWNLAIAPFCLRYMEEED